MFHTKQHYRKLFLVSHIAALFCFGISSHERTITVTVDVPENIRNTVKAGDVNIFYKTDVVTAEKY